MSPPRIACKPISSLVLLPTIPFLPNTPTSSGSLSSASAITSNAVIAVPEGESFFWLWCASIISISKSYNKGANFFNVLKNTFTPMDMLDEITAPTLFSSTFLMFEAICSSVKPVVPTTTFTPHAVAVLIVSTAA